MHEIYTFKSRLFLAHPLFRCKSIELLCYCCHKGDEATSIAVQSCAMPYILNGEEYHNCSGNAAESNDLGGYHGDGQSQWVNCQQPQGAFLKVTTLNALTVKHGIKRVN